MFDSHIHSKFSFDGDKSSSAAAICESAIEKGFSNIAITDHLELNAIATGDMEMYLDSDASKEAIIEAQQKFEGRINLSYSIEMGQISQYPDLAEKFIAKYEYQSIIGSIHNIREKRDFCFWDMRKVSESEFCENWVIYLNELSEMIDLAPIDILAHLTYPLRYYKIAGRDADLDFDRPLLEKILQKVIDRNILLEVNSSGFRQKIGSPLPDERVLRIYKEIGGKLISTGSDAHNIRDIGADYDKLYDYLRNCGFDKVHFIKNKQIIEQTI